MNIQTPLPPARVWSGGLLALLSTAAFLYSAPEEPSKSVEPALKQAQIKGLLVIQLADGSFAGTASQMNATVIRGEKDRFTIGFNQKVGSQMSKATDEVQKFISVRHDQKIPLGHRIELAFADKYSPKDGPSAAVVCALLADSIITGEEIDPIFAATGDMTATGEVRPVGGITGKVRGAINKGCGLIGIPKPNAKSITDIYLIEGVKPLYEIQIFSIETFGEAKSIASKKRTTDIQKAITEFAAVQKVLKRDEKYLRNQAVRDKLKAIVQLAPNHLSARLLFLHGDRQAPKKLSLAGSLEGIDHAAQTFGVMLKTGAFLDRDGNDDVLFKLIGNLQKLRQKLDKRTIPYSDAYMGVAEYFKQFRDRPSLNAQQQRELQAKIRKLDVERTKILNNAEVREELMIE